MPAREGRGWPTARSTVRQTCQQHTWKRSRAQSSSAQPGSSSEQNDDTLDTKLTDSLWAVASNRDREHKETRLTLVTRQATQVKSEELIDQVQTEIVQLVEQLNTNHAQGEASR